LLETAEYDEYARWREDFVIANAETRSLEDFVAAAFSCVDLDWHEHVAFSPNLSDLGHYLFSA
jgi:hypothetical protein